MDNNLTVTRKECLSVAKTERESFIEDFSMEKITIFKFKHKHWDPKYCSWLSIYSTCRSVHDNNNQMPW